MSLRGNLSSFGPAYLGLPGREFSNASLGCNSSTDSVSATATLIVATGEAGHLGSHCLAPPPADAKNWPALLIVVAVALTVTGNILVIMAVSLEKRLQNATNYFLMSLAVADMLLGLLVMPVAMVTILYGYSWPLPPTLCPIWIYLDVLFSTASIMHLCAISLDRYIAIRNPIQHSRFNSRMKAFMKIMAVWTISVGISMPIPVLGLRDHSKVFKNHTCQLTDNNFVLVGSFVAFFVPLIIMVVTYFLTIGALQNEATLCLDQLVPKPKWAIPLNFLPQGSLSSEKLFFRRSLSREAGPQAGRRTMQSISNEQKASKVLGIVFFLFVFMWCPFFITNVLAVVCGGACSAGIMDGLLNVFVWVGYLSSAVNPLVYTLFNKTYRSAFWRYARCRYREERKPLQLILVNTIPPVAFSHSQLPLGDIAPLRNGNCGAGRHGYAPVASREDKLGLSELGGMSTGEEKVSCV
ncbi:5-hydroxytryptamine receptor 2A isoform X1 [Paramormyrops kingsleyae]|uniref:5-hydroxytryptamine receptor 2A isoform X1 n=1 Tax=Paramormyrops kingsleyae TaxID=1676925 RepID=UPI003B9765FF